MKIIFTIILIFFSFINLTFANQNIWCEGFNCRSPLNEKLKIWEIWGNIEEIIISKDKDFKVEDPKKKVFNNLDDFNVVESWLRTVYSFTNWRWEVILFDYNLNAYNLNRWIYYDNPYRGVFNLLSVFDNNNYIFFLSKDNTLTVFSKKLYKYFTIKLSFDFVSVKNWNNYIQDWYNHWSASVNWVSVYWNELNFYTYLTFPYASDYWLSQKYLNVWAVKYSIDLTKIKDSDFNISNYYLENSQFTSKYTKLYLSLKNSNDPLDFEKILLDEDFWKLKLNYYSWNLPYSDLNFSETKFFKKINHSNFLSMEILAKNSLHFSLKENNLTKLRAWNVYYLWNNFLFWLTPTTNAYTNDLAIYYTSEWYYQNRLLNLNWVFNLHKLLWIYFNEKDQKYYVSLYVDSVWSPPRFVTLRFPKKNFIKLTNVEIFENAYYLWQFWKIHFHWNNSLINLDWFNNQLNFQTFFLTKYKWNLHFSYLKWKKPLNWVFDYNKFFNYEYDILTTIKPIIEWSWNEEIDLDFYSWFSESLLSKDWKTHDSKDVVWPDWKVTTVVDDEQPWEAWFLEKVTSFFGNGIKKFTQWVVDFALSSIKPLNDFLEFVKTKLSFWFDENQTITIPTLQFVLDNWKTKIKYVPVVTRLPPLRDNLNISIIEPVNNNVSKWISVLLALLYLFFRYSFIWLYFLPLVFFYYFFNKYFETFTWANKNTSIFSNQLNLLQFWSLVFVLSFMMTTFLTWLTYMYLLNPLFDIALWFVNLLFGYFVINFFDLDTFKAFILFMNSTFVVWIGIYFGFRILSHWKVA